MSNQLNSSQVIHTPEDIEIQDNANSLEIRYTRLHVLWALFATLYALPAAGSIGRRLASNDSLIAPGLIVYLSFLLVAYVFYALSINRTVVSVDDKALQVRYWPLPWFGGCTLETSELRHLYVKETENLLPTWHIDKPVFTVMAVLEDLREVRIVTTADPNSALYIKYRLETAVGLETRRSVTRLAGAQ